ncbi:hypothetical protein EA796_02030 [Pseudomonas sp. AOB-7]|uniref:DUF6685 family protein n=1 Tax=unclassified Pseudomonas TaxID=196821 RepID=UPI000397A3D4|nr:MULTISPECIES: DUF6685 family protein [unclassified Pseudomonas]ERI54178.1 hypothetical protein N878_12490 [Pseudomonas sp. EGD-AK9]RMH86631.1 hypothetical protein EA796_02030 [Pseudomonas sp. AOB-7]
MSLSEPSTLSTRLTALAQRLGLIGRGSRQIFARASALRLPFRVLPPPGTSICWHEGPPLQRLVDLPRGALSGPVQEDKAQAHAALTQVVTTERQHLQAFDLRLVDGFACNASSQHGYASFEDYAASEHCKQVRIISYKDFVKTISQALPRFLAGEAVELRQAGWHGTRTFWAGEQQGEAFAGAIVYARRRGLEVLLPANLTRYRLSASGLENLQLRYHVLAMPGEAWSDPHFMGLLLDNGLPYARLSLLKTAGAPEFLLLPKEHPQATALGEGLRLAGAPDVLDYLRQLAQ